VQNELRSIVNGNGYTNPLAQHLNAPALYTHVRAAFGYDAVRSLFLFCFFYMHVRAAFGYDAVGCLLLPVVACCCLLLPVVACCCLLLFVIVLLLQILLFYDHSISSFHYHSVFLLLSFYYHSTIILFSLFGLTWCQARSKPPTRQSLTFSLAWSRAMIAALITART